jgi:hypothetical protein
MRRCGYGPRLWIRETRNFIIQALANKPEGIDYNMLKYMFLQAYPNKTVAHFDLYLDGLVCSGVLVACASRTHTSTLYRVLAEGWLHAMADQANELRT